MNQVSRATTPLETPAGGRGSTILIVEDSPLQTERLCRTLEGKGYQVLAAANGAEGLAMTQQYRPAAIVIDIDMPVLDGFAMCEAVRQEGKLDPAPIIVLTILTAPQDLLRGLNAGADAYLTRPYDIPTLVSRLESLLSNPPSPASRTERQQADNQVKLEATQLQKTFMQTMEAATHLSAMRDRFTAGHERRAADIAVHIGAVIGLDANRQQGLRVAALLHDVGKIIIQSEILSKPGKLSAIQVKMIQRHTQVGYDVLKEVQFPWPVAEVALQHHERPDGSGYPQGLKGEAILFEARIVAVADVVEAMISHRPYRAGPGIEAALSEIERGRGTAYDPVVADACLKLFREKAYVIAV